ncbi:imelysin family protein [Flavobacterium sp. 7A]|uniref:imelysin family protein n=1 Tax=Flavobacterium sp. 7A TaxID=2940571 RepID=UPI002227F0CD|nr:imelysin family protein [Flavobacterium sp. 7A]MCW2118965.1 putative iron-regulated protein [Flavobacterium sp. 7A]
MNISTLKGTLILGTLAFFISCSSDNTNNSAVSKKEVIENYANIAYANYQKAYDDAVVLESAITTFTSNPTDANFTLAKTSWKAARESYGTTEAFRFADGPIDNADGPEGFINSWPLDENYIDYVQGAPNAGIINEPVLFPIINKDVLEGENGKNDNEKYVTVGYHAIEFLLWGQDLTPPSAKLPGQRPYTDYVLVGGTAMNQVRRATYLKVCADLLTDHLQYVANQWKPGGPYRTTFLALNEDVAIKNMYRGVTTLISAELPSERMEVALGNEDQEDEQSCFSDNTHRDIALNLQGAINVYQGKYSSIDGASLEDLVQQANSTTYTETQTQIGLATSSIAAIAIPFDYAISGGATSVEGAKVKVAVVAIKNLAKNILDGATKIGIYVNS